jgi:hypothetical protein
MHLSFGLLLLICNTIGPLLAWVLLLGLLAQSYPPLLPHHQAGIKPAFGPIFEIPSSAPR